MREQAIPFVTILIFWLINIILKRKIVCISNLVFAYYFFCFGGAILVHLNPRTGVPFSDLNAMKYLAWAEGFLLMPLLFFKDVRHEPEMLLEEFHALDRMKDYIWIIFFLLVYSEICFSPNLIRFLRFLSQSADREAFRLTIDRTLRGNIILSLAALFLGFAKPALFFCILYIIFGETPEHKKIAIAMAVASLAYPMWSMQQIDRRETGKIIFMLMTLYVVFYHYIDGKRRRVLRKYICYILGLLLIPFLTLSIVRYRGEWFYQLLQYFAIGPYYFNADYVANTEMNLPLFMGDYCFPLISKPIHSMTGVQVPLTPEEMWMYPELHHKIYWMISQCHPFEFKTHVGCFLLDFTPGTAMQILASSGIVLSIFFLIKKYDMAYLFFMSIYSFTLLYGTIMFAFASFIFNVELIMLIIIAFTLQHLINQETKQMHFDARKDSSEMQSDCHLPESGNPESGDNKTSEVVHP